MLKLRPIIVDENNIILGGNMRYKACQELNFKEVYILKAKDLTEEQKQEFIIKDNVGFGEWDWDILANRVGSKKNYKIGDLTIFLLKILKKLQTPNNIDYRKYFLLLN